MSSSTTYAHAAMAIDLGAEFLKMALIKPGVPMEIVLNRESQRKTPFALTIKQGERFFGSEALKKGVAATRNTYTFFLDLIGKPFDDHAVKDYQTRFPYLQLKQNDQRGSVNFMTDAGEIPVETMLAMVLANARSEVETYAGQPVKDAVIAVPAHFGPGERQAVETAARIAGLNPLQLLSAGAAAALNYGVFRYKDITQEPQTLLIYDVGSTKVQATVVQYVLANEANEDGKLGGLVPKLEVIGWGVDSNIGGNHLTLKLRDQLVEAFRRQHPRTESDITSNPQAMAKLLREADRVKQVLSANLETYAQVECLFLDLDFRAKCTRQELEALFGEFEPRILDPVKAALAMAQVGVGKLDRILLMGAGTRVPRLQEMLAHFFNGKELSRNLNTDEAIALGAIYQAARQSRNFIVKRFDVVDSKAPEHGKKGQMQGQMDEKEMNEAKALLFHFESREKAKVERDAALNSLESTVFDYSARIEEKEFAKFGNTEELGHIAKLLANLNEWLEDVPDEASADQLKEKRRELLKPIKKIKSRIRQKEERPESVAKLTKVVDEAEKQLPALWKGAETEVFTAEEIGEFAQLVANTKAWLQHSTKKQQDMADHEEPLFTTDELKTKTTALSREVKLLSNKLKTAPKTKEAAANGKQAQQGGGEAAAPMEDGKQADADVDMKEPGQDRGGGQQSKNNGTMEVE